MKILIFDIETTGLDRSIDQIIQLSCIIFDTETNEVVDSLNKYIQPVGNYSISPGAFFKHQITPQFLSDKPYMPEVAQEIVEFFNKCDNILTYNGSSFDIPFLKSALNKYDYDIDFMKKNCYDAFLEEKRRNGISLENTYKRYTGKSMEDAGLTAHDANSDIMATYTIFKEQSNINGYEPEKMYGEDNVITDMSFLGEVVPCFNIGKYRGVSLTWVAQHDQNYLHWAISDKCKFMPSTKEFIKKYVVYI